MPDRDAAFREALDALVVRLCAKSYDGYEEKVADVRLALNESRLLALYAEAQQQGERDQLALAEQVAEATMRMEQGRAERQGEEAVVTDGTPDGQYIELRFVQSTRITDGDRVWVTKVEEGQ